ncbi:hypothetical protein LTR28_007305 [Elasticomyces elasticus]|nr:hypothetical protein LTR28_007305 [Elasticomyces elasticus]
MDVRLVTPLDAAVRKKNTDYPQDAVLGYGQDELMKQGGQLFRQNLPLRARPQGLININKMSPAMIMGMVWAKYGDELVRNTVPQKQAHSDSARARAEKRRERTNRNKNEPKHPREVQALSQDEQYQRDQNVARAHAMLEGRARFHANALDEEQSEGAVYNSADYQTELQANPFVDAVSGEKAEVGLAVVPSYDNNGVPTMTKHTDHMMKPADWEYEAESGLSHNMPVRHNLATNLVAKALPSVPSKPVKDQYPLAFYNPRRNYSKPLRTLEDRAVASDITTPTRIMRKPVTNTMVPVAPYTAPDRSIAGAMSPPMTPLVKPLTQLTYPTKPTWPQRYQAPQPTIYEQLSHESYDEYDGRHVEAPAAGVDRYDSKVPKYPDLSDLRGLVPAPIRIPNRPIAIPIATPVTARVATHDASPSNPEYTHYHHHAYHGLSSFPHPYQHQYHSQARTLTPYYDNSTLRNTSLSGSTIAQAPPRPHLGTRFVSAGPGAQMIHERPEVEWSVAPPPVEGTFSMAKDELNAAAERATHARLRDSNDGGAATVRESAASPRKKKMAKVVEKLVRSFGHLGGSGGA